MEALEIGPQRNFVVGRGSPLCHGLPVPFEFEQRPAPAPLKRWLSSVWFARGQIDYEREQIAPTGATVVVINLGDPILHATVGPRATALRAEDGWVSGPHDRPSSNAPAGRTHCYGVVSTALGSQSLFGLDPRTLFGRVVPLEVWKRGPALRRTLRPLEPDAGLPLLLESLAAGLCTPPPRIERVEQAHRELEQNPSLSIGEIAERVGVSHAHLDREFSRVVGLTPRRLAAILRVRRLLAEIDVFGETDWAAATAAHGWYDQSHLIRDFKRTTGATPSAYVTAQRTHFAREEAASAGGFVPEGRRA